MNDQFLKKIVDYRVFGGVLIALGYGSLYYMLPKVVRINWVTGDNYDLFKILLAVNGAVLIAIGVFELITKGAFLRSNSNLKFLLGLFALLGTMSAVLITDLWLG